VLHVDDKRREDRRCYMWMISVEKIVGGLVLNRVMAIGSILQVKHNNIMLKKRVQ
jgi:hypothetical protein